MREGVLLKKFNHEFVKVEGGYRIMNRDENQEAMTANEYTPPKRHMAPMHPAPPTFLEMYAGPLLCIAVALVLGFVCGYGVAVGAR